MTFLGQQIAKRLSDWLDEPVMRRLARMMAWTTVATLLGRGLPILGMILAARVLGASDFAAAWPVLIVLCLAAVLAAPSTVVGHVLVSHERVWAWFGANLVWGGVLVALAAVLLDRGALGLALAWLGGNLARAAVLFLLVRRKGLKDVGTSPASGETAAP